MSLYFCGPEFLWLGYEMIDHLQTLGISGATVSWFIKIIENAAFSLKIQPRYKSSSDMMFLIFQISNHLLHNSQALGNMLSRVSAQALTPQWCICFHCSSERLCIPFWFKLASIFPFLRVLSFKKYLCIYRSTCGVVSYGMWDLYRTLTRDWTWAPYVGSMES